MTPVAKNIQKFLGEGSYGCAWKPGINCNGKTTQKILLIKFKRRIFIVLMNYLSVILLKKLKIIILDFLL